MEDIFLVPKVETEYTSCAACSVAATICPRPLQVVTNSGPFLSAWRSLPTSVMWIILLRSYTKFEVRVRGLPVAKIYDCFSVTAFSGLMTLSFDLSIYKWGHGSPVSWASTLSIFSFLRPSLLDLGSDTRRTDNGRQCYILSPCGGRGTIIIMATNISQSHCKLCRQ